VAFEDGGHAEKEAWLSFMKDRTSVQKVTSIYFRYPRQTSSESGTFVEYRPLSSITDGAPIEFDIMASGDDYIDFANSLLHVKVKIERANGAALEDISRTC